MYKIIISVLVGLFLSANVASAETVKAPIKYITVTSFPIQISIKPLPVTQPVLSIKPIQLCPVADNLMKEYDQLTLDLRKAEQAGDKEAVEAITKKIVDIKQTITEMQKKCQKQLYSISPPLSISKSVPPKAVDVNYCSQISQLENKISYYSKLNTLGDDDLKKEYSFPREEIERIILLLKADLAKARAQCENQKYSERKPTSKQVFFKNNNLPVVTSTQPYPKNEILLTVSQVTEKLNIEPKSVELKQQNSIAIYEIKIPERRRLFGFIPLNISKVITANAENGNVTKEVLPWYSFLTTK